MKILDAEEKRGIVKENRMSVTTEWQVQLIVGAKNVRVKHARPMKPIIGYHSCRCYWRGRMRRHVHVFLS